MNADGALDLPTLTRVLVGMCDAMVASIDDFAHADQAIGDGDHGLAIGRGFHAAKRANPGRRSPDCRAGVMSRP